MEFVKLALTELGGMREVLVAEIVRGGMIWVAVCVAAASLWVGVPAWALGFGRYAPRVREWVTRSEIQALLALVWLAISLILTLLFFVGLENVLFPNIQLLRALR